MFQGKKNPRRTGIFCLFKSLAFHAVFHRGDLRRPTV